MATQVPRSIDVESDALEAARSLGPTIRAAAREIERERRLTADVVEALRGAGLFHLTIPRSLGGRETDPVTHLRVVEEIAAADGSAGWCVMIAAQIGWEVAMLDPASAREVAGNGNVVCGVGRPIGRAVPVDAPEAGYRVSGRWPFASGSSHADWFGGECLVYDDGADEPRRNEAGEHVVVTFLAPRERVEVHDVWYTTGLRGTASNDFSVDDLFIPAEFAFKMPAEPQHPWPALQAPPLIFMNHGAHALGIARAALAEATMLVGAKRGWGGVPLRETGRLQEAIAGATAQHEASRGYFYDLAESLWAEVRAGEAKLLTRAKARLAASHAANASVQVVDGLHRALATSAIMSASPLDRQFRDIHTAVAHVMVGPLTYEAAGRVILSQEARFPLF